ncbi:MAG: YciI family protein [Micromonosporaceae bacterium]|nr:YciI family protein [Micromonosporaceae bacterium]
MKYMLLLRVPQRPAEGTPEWDQMGVEFGAAKQAMESAGVLVDCAPLAWTDSATTVRVRDGQTLLTDGPAAEIKEHLGGYTILDCADLDEALKWAAANPAAVTGSVEVRPILAP